MRRDPYAPYPPDCADADEVRRGMTSQRRYVADDTDAGPITQPSRPVRPQRASHPAQQTGVPQRRREANTVEFYTAQTERLSSDRQSPTQTQPSRASRPPLKNKTNNPYPEKRPLRHQTNSSQRIGNTTTRSIPAQTRPVHAAISRRDALLIFSGVGLLVSGMGFFKGRSYVQNRLLDQLSEGAQRSTNIDIVCGHNHDSAQHQTQIHAYIHNNRVVVVELPAGDDSKAHITTSQDLRDLGYRHDPNLAVLTIEPAASIHGKILQLVIRVEGGPVDLLGGRQGLQLIMTDDGTAYRAAQGQK